MCFALWLNFTILFGEMSTGRHVVRPFLMKCRCYCYSFCDKHNFDNLNDAAFLCCICAFYRVLNHRSTHLFQSCVLQTSVQIFLSVLQWHKAYFDVLFEIHMRINISTRYACRGGRRACVQYGAIHTAYGSWNCHTPPSTLLHARQQFYILAIHVHTYHPRIIFYAEHLYESAKYYWCKIIAFFI